MARTKIIAQPQVPVPFEPAAETPAATHTAGPWYSWKSHASGTLNISRVGTNEFVCEVGMPDLPRVKADAALILAAPDLLAALQALDERGHTQATWSLAKRALNKATSK